MTRRYRWADYKTTEFENLDPQKVIAVLPTAAIEQHGPHLPVGVDTFLNEGMLASTEALLPELAPQLDVRILPVQAVGKSNEHLHAPGTLTLPADVALKAWTEIGLSVARAGVRKLVIVNSHGGNLDLISILARELRVQARMLAVKHQWGSYGAPDGLYTDDEMRFGIHGGDVETSMMLHFHPDLVDMSKAKNFRSTAQALAEGANDAIKIPPTGMPAYGWISSDLNPDGTVGDASIATAEKGAATADHYARKFIGLLEDVAATDITRFD
ncbi:MAG: creatininase family protein [Devosiaceae bacterium]|nr:creatininase family protein [Devosiaceae bacterium MH13]